MELMEARWGLVPHWWKGHKLPALTFNARSEAAAEKPMWRHSYSNCRCLMPAEGWYEWREMQSVDKNTGEVHTVKQPYYCNHRSQPTIAFAGLLSFSTRPDGQKLVSCALLSKAASQSVSHIHDRMPVVLVPEFYGTWLDARQHKEQAQLMVEQSQTDFASHPVSRQVNSTKHDSPELVKEAALAL